MTAALSRPPLAVNPIPGATGAYRSMAAGTPLNILLASPEVGGFAKTGGLADVAGSLPRALAKLGHTVAVIQPLYRCVRRGPVPIQPTEHWLPVPIGGQIVPTRLWKSTLPQSDVTVYFVENADLFERDDPAYGRGLYQTTGADGGKYDYPDNAYRFTFFCRAVMEAVPCLGFIPDILHANDWQTGLLPVYLHELYRNRQAYRKLRSLLTVHNIAYQGVFPQSEYHLTGLDHRLFNQHQLEYYGQLNFLKAGIVFANWVNTVSPTYAQEIRTTYFGYGLEGVLTERRDRLSGIVNGVDYDTWNTATDPFLAAHYTSETVLQGKPLCKADLQRYFHLPQAPEVPVLAMIARLVEQKGVDIVCKAAEELLKQDVQLVVLGEGSPEYHQKLSSLRERFPLKVGLLIGFNEDLAHRIEAGADLYLMPSLFEPSGLNQLYSLRYGTPPIVRATGGLADTIVDATDAAIEAGTASGFRFQAYSAQTLLATIQRAIEMRKNRPDRFLKLMRSCMKQDWSWERSAREYESTYRQLAAERDSQTAAARFAEWR
jgi:starch synthase